MRVYVILILMILATGAVLWWASQPGQAMGAQDTREGVVAGSVGISAHAIMADGSVDLYHAGIGRIGQVPITYETTAHSAAGDRRILLLVHGVRLIIGEMGALDMRNLGIEVSSSKTEHLRLVTDPPLGSGQWIISGRSGTTTFSRADNDTLLEPGEQFDLLLFPEAPVSPADRITVRLLPPGSVPYPLTCVVPYP
ncbi:MAG: hypothetical protein LUQ01_04305 [Methanolinea sp.]|nr:hypothetical protein [Methanolinea sp.]